MPDEKTNNEEMHLPMMNVNVGVPVPTDAQKTEIVKAEQLINLSTEILDDIRDDSKKVLEAYDNFSEMVINEGDGSQASKEAMVNLLKIKTEIADKKTRVMDLLLRAFMKDRFTPSSIAQTQNINIEHSNKRKLLKALEEEIKEN